MQKLIEIESPIVAMGRWVGPKTLPAIAALMGGLVFAALAGGAVIDPARLGWIAGSDAATGYLGWLFFRLAPWAWPPGGLHVAGFGPDSLVAAGSIPLLAFFFKLFSRLLPGNFQYIGLWLVACYALQGFFAYRLLALFTLRMPFLLGGVLLFVLSPILLGQLQTDPALAAQWIMLAGFYLYYANPDRGRPMAWLALLWLATLVHGYLALMVLATWLAHAFQRRRISSTCVAFMSVALGGAAALLWLSGYFVRFGTSASRFDAGTTNAVALFSSLGQMSFRPAASAMFASGQLVNFHQLGLGVIAALVLGMATLRTHRQQRSVTDAPAVTPDRAVAMACVALTALALLPWLAWAAHRLFIAPPGDSAAALSTAIGAFGPLLWPTYYLLMLVAWRGLQRLPGRASAIALTVVLMLQLIDLMPYLHATQRGFAAKAQADGFASLDSPFWRQARTRYAHLHLAAADANVGLVNDFRYAAGLYGFIGDPSEGDGTVSRPLIAQRNVDLLEGHTEADSLYIVPFETLQALQKKPDLFPASTGLGIVDGLSIVAPGWFDADGSHVLHRQGEIDYPPVSLNRTISFAKGGSGGALLAGGWSSQEDAGFFSDSASSKLAFHVPDAPGDLRVVFDLMPYLPAPFPRLGVGLQINGKTAGHWSFGSSSANPPTTLVIASGVIAQQKNVTVTFVFDSPRSPLEAGASTDPRKLAVFIRSMRIQPAKASEDEGSSDPSD
jgi:hypothetical protein